MLSKISIKRPVTTVMLILMVFLGGILAYSSLKLELMPSMNIPMAVVSTSYTGAGPEEIENLITKPIEAAMGTVTNVETVSSISSNGSSIVIIEFVDGTDVDMAALDMREKIDMIKGYLPEDADSPMVLKIDINAEPITVGVTSSKLDLKELNTLINDEISNSIEKIEGVSSVNVSGGLEDEIEIIINPEKMQGYGLNVLQIMQSLATENLNYPAGNIKQGEAKLQVRILGEFKSIEDIKYLPITTPTGAVIYLNDVAEVSRTSKEADAVSIINGVKGVTLSIDKQSTANLVEVSDRITETIKKLNKEYPQINVQMISSSSGYIKYSINNVVSTAFQSALVAVIVLLIFLKDAKTSLVIGMSIPVSIMATFALMYLRGMSMNIISMGGITIGIGMLVDNSVVVLENIFTRWKKGEEPKEAAYKGASEVAMAVTASTLTTVAVFLPLAFTSGIVGQIFQDLSFTICFALMSSLVVSLTFVPMMCSRLLSEDNRGIQPKKGLFTKFLDSWENGLEGLNKFYQKVLRWAFKNKKKTIAIVLAAFIGTLAITPIMGFDFMPEMDEGSASITVEMPKGTVLDKTISVVDTVLEKISDIPEISLIYANIGGGSSFSAGSSDSATVSVALVGKAQREKSTKEVVKEIEQRLSSIAGAEITVAASDAAMGELAGASLSLQISGDDIEVLQNISKDVIALINEIPGAKDITSSAGETVPETNVVVNRAKASQYGVSASSIANALSSAVKGTIATQYKVDGTEIDVTIRYDKNRINYINDLKNITVMTASGAAVPITEVADIVTEESAVSISRENQHRYITIEGNIEGKDTSTIEKLVEEKLSGYEMPDGYSYSFTGIMKQMEEAFSSLFLVLIVAVLLVYMIMASQFESLVYPFIVMFSMPIAITGGILGLFVTGNTITVVSFMGFIMLVGMVVNNAIVLIDYTNQIMEQEHIKCEEALLEAGPNRLRPILMTTLTTVVGLVPMAVGRSEGMEMEKPLAIVVIFGLMLSTVITLVFIPVLYSVIDKLRLRNRKKRNKYGIQIDK